MTWAGRSRIDPDMVEEIIKRANLSLIGGSEAIFGGTCPLCGKEKSFTLWAAKGTFRCFWCGADGRFIISPEREAEKRRRARAERDAMAV
jgi:Zn ribbon nucleic-acid-binding protein